MCELFPAQRAADERQPTQSDQGQHRGFGDGKGLHKAAGVVGVTPVGNGLARVSERVNGTVALTGEAKDYLAVLSYVANIEQQKAFSRVHLARHEVRYNEPQRPMTFTISASWKERR